MKAPRPEGPPDDDEIYEDEVPMDPWPRDAVELRVQLKGSKPPVWRRVVVHPATGMEELHRIIAVLFGLEEGEEHRFQAGKEDLRPGKAGYGERSISEFPPGKALTYIVGEGDGRTFNVKVVSDQRRRTASLPTITGGLRKLDRAKDEDPNDIGDLDIIGELWPFRRFDELTPDRDGNMVERWRTTALAPSEKAIRDYESFFSNKGDHKPRTLIPLRPVPDKVPPGTGVELKVTLEDMPVPVWRKVLVGSEITFAELHEVIQRALGWEGYHLYQFEAGDSLIQPFDDEMDVIYGTELIDASLIRLRDLLTGQGWSIEYEYDFGDGWKHQVKAVKVRERGPTFVRPELLDGEGACPPEDCGGPYGYAGLIKAANDPQNEEHEEVAEWLGKDRLDPSEFDLEGAKRKIAGTLWLPL